MSTFRTVLPNEPSLPEINYKTLLFGIGSCFAENITEKLKHTGFSVFSNPMGILFNPASIGDSIYRVMELRKVTKNDLFEKDDVWYSFDFHSRFSATDSENAIELMNQSISLAHQHLKECHFLIITFGSSWVYELKNKNKVVGNCHKLPSNNFTRRRLDLIEIGSYWMELLSQIKRFNPSINVLLSVSPIRHIKDGMEENQISKSILRLLCDTLTHQFDGVNYFPAYEIMMDDLRDYRFYAQDMIHPNQSAIDYIWDFFCNRYINKETQGIMKEVVKLNQALLHRPFHSETLTHQDFLTQLKLKLELFKNQHPDVNLFLPS